MADCRQVSLTLAMAISVHPSWRQLTDDGVRPICGGDKKEMVERSEAGVEQRHGLQGVARERTSKMGKSGVKD